MSFTIGSLFDGSGGFPLAAFLSGGTPLWASEVEPYPIAVTKTRFPHMKHLGSVTEVRGDVVDPVDVITFGSPCQDLSVAGKRAGLKHESNGDEETTRSGLFMEAVRIIREMREATHGVYPRFAVWENVPGAFSSNKGEDFRIVLEELIKIVEAEAEMPPVPEGGWPYADCYLGDGWSLAYRVFDAQYWGVPQRRRRIYLVLDLGGQCAEEVLFERDGLRGYFAQSGAAWEGTTSDAEGSSGADDRPGEGNGINAQTHAYTISAKQQSLAVGDELASCLGANDYKEPQTVFCPIAFAQNQRDEVRDLGDKATALQAQPGMRQQTFIVLESAGFCPEQSAKTRGIGYAEEEAPTLRAGVTPAVVYSIENHPADSRVNIDATGKVQTLTGRMGTGGGNVPMVMEQSVICCIDGDKIGKADRAGGSGLGIREGDKMYTLTAKDAGTHSVCYGIGNGQANQSFMEERVGTLNCMHDQQAICYGVDCRNFTESPELYPTLQAKPNGGQSLNYSGAVRTQYIVRRLTPTECARLQGFADTFGHIAKKHNLLDSEYHFWLEVRNTHAEINGKPTKSYTKDQMLKWYNKLHTDSSEYKMWGNGIALPCALYVMQGIADVLN